MGDQHLPEGVTVVEEREIAVIADEWDLLADRVGAAPFTRPGWFACWLDAFGEGEPLLITTRAGGRLTGVLPLERRARSLRSLTNSNSPTFELLAETPAEARVLGRRLFALGPGHVFLEFAERRGLTLEGALPAAAERRYRTTSHLRARSPYVEVRGSWDSYTKRIPSKRRSNLRRARRRLGEMGHVELSVSDGRQSLAELLEEGFAVEPSGWKAAGGTAIVSQTETRRFYQRVAEWAADGGWLRLAYLRLDGRPVAFQYAFEASGVHYFFKGGYDPAYRSYAPGILLTEALLERAFAIGLDRFEFLGADEPWKLEWASACRDLITLECYSPSAVGLAQWVWRKYAGPWAATLRTAGARLARR